LLDNISGKEKQRWKHIYRLLLEGRVPHHKEDFICSSPVEKRIHQLRISPKKDDDGNVAWLVHHTRRIDETRNALAFLSKRLGKFNDPNRVTQEYRQRVIKRTIRIPRFRAARHFIPLEDIGGDLLWHREFPEGVAHLAHADVMGHGTAAGRLATQMAIILDEVTDTNTGPSATVSALNRAMLELTSDDDVFFATGLIFRFDQRGPQLTCSNFGHHDPLFSRTGQLHIDGGPPAGLADEAAPWPETRIDMVKNGYRFLVFSDGITEQFNIEGDMFGTTRLLQAFLRYLELPLNNMLTKIVGELNGFRRSALVKDDQTLLALEFVGDKNEIAA
jgi:sigma-B regulation protein RsbU (phosphoserine phosphatase)